MQFKPGTVSRNHNVSDSPPLREFGVLFAGISALLLCLYWLLGLAVDSVVEELPEDWVHNHYQANEFSFAQWQPSPELQNIVDNLARCSDIHFPLSVSVVQSEQVNAVALPTGDILVFSELLHKLRSENGLAFVLAHEMSHFKNRDHLRQMGRAVVLTALWGLITGDTGALNQAFAPAMMAGESRYSRERESQADLDALDVLHCYYGHVGGATELFDYYRKTPDSQLQPGFLLSHPLPELRINAMVQRAKQQGYKARKPAPLTQYLPKDRRRDATL